MAIVDIDLIPIGSAEPKALVLYDNGNAKADYFPMSAKFDLTSITSYTGTNGSVSNNATNIVAKSNANNTYVVGMTKAKIDLTNYCKVVFEIAHPAISYKYMSLVMVASTNTARSGWTVEARTQTTSATTSEILEIDVSALSGEYYLCIGACDSGGETTLKKITLEPYPTKLERNELYAYGLGINKWDNSGYLVNQNYSQKGGFDIQPNYLYSKNTTNSKSNCIVTDEMVDLSKWSTLNIVINNKSYSFDISSRTDMQYIVISQAYTNGTVYNRVYLAPNKNYYGHTSFTIDSSASMSVTKVWLE